MVKSDNCIEEEKKLQNSEKLDCESGHEVGRHVIHMPKLSDLHSIHISKVNEWIQQIPHSRYYKVKTSVIVSELSYGEAYRHLSDLIKLNSAYKSNLNQI